MQQIKAHEGTSGLIVSMYGNRWSEDFGEEQRSGDSKTNAYRGIILYKIILQYKQKRNRFTVENFTNVVSNAHALHRVLTCETQQYQVTYK